MEQFHDGHHVRLRSRQLGTYLHAEENGLGVSLHHRRASMNAAWAVLLHQGKHADYLLLYSAAYGRYLVATEMPAPGGGRRVVQRNYDHPELEAMVWYATLSESGNEVLLNNFQGGCLRANVTYPYLDRNNSVSVCDIGNVTTMMHWVVEHIPAGDGMPPLPPPTELPFPAAILDWRLIQYVWPKPNVERGSFWFLGRSVFRLRNELAGRLAIEVANLVMCLRTDIGWVTPLLVDLPRNHETLLIVVVVAGTPGEIEALNFPLFFFGKKGNSHSLEVVHMFWVSVLICIVLSKAFQPVANLKTVY